MTKGHPLKGCLFYFPNFFSLIEFFYIWKYENHPRGNSLTVAWPGTARSPAIWQIGNVRGGTRSQLRRPLFPLGLPLVGHAEKHVIKRGICGNFEGACEVVQLANTYFQGLVSEFVEYVGGGEGVSGRGKPEEVREST